MKLSKNLIPKIILIFSINPFFNSPKVEAAENIKIVYGIFSRTIKVESLKTFAEKGQSSKKLQRILNATGTPNNQIRSALNKNFEIPITIASKLVYSEIGNVVLTRLSTIIHTPKTTDEKTGMLALRSSFVQGVFLGNGRIDLVKFFEGYPTKTVILNVNALSKVMNKVESISDLLDFFTNKPLEKIQKG